MMDIFDNGKHIVFAANSDEQLEVYELMCVCGHRLIEHASPIFWHSPDALHHTIYVRQCTHFKKGVFPVESCCEQFQLAGIPS